MAGGLLTKLLHCLVVVFVVAMFLVGGVVLWRGVKRVDVEEVEIEV